MSGLNLKTINSAENEFLAENSLITIVSGVDHPQLKFISGDFGPLISGLPCQVPLWLAITLRKKGKCTIQIPEWMSNERLEAYVAHEKTQKMLGELPFHYMEIAQLLLNNARDDIKSPDKVAALLQDLENIRMDRIQQGVMSTADSVNNNESVVYVALNNVSSMEINALKQFFLGSMDMFYLLCPPITTMNLNEPTSSSQYESAVDDENRVTAQSKRLRRFRNN